MRKGNGVSGLIKGVNIIPGSTEFGYDTKVITRTVSVGVTASENAHVSAQRSDWSNSVDQLQQACENIEAVSLVVTWFGTDLRCGLCQIKPGVDSATKITSPATWTVSNTSRAAAYQISSINGSAAFGGTPADATVIRAIQDARARGLKVTFYPFILMDIPSTNNLPDPYGGAQQAVYPWRGRITSTVNRTAPLQPRLQILQGSPNPPISPPLLKP